MIFHDCTVSLLCFLSTHNNITSNNKYKTPFQRHLQPQNVWQHFSRGYQYQNIGSLGSSFLNQRKRMGTPTSEHPSFKQDYDMSSVDFSDKRNDSVEWRTSTLNLSPRTVATRTCHLEKFWKASASTGSVRCAYHTVLTNRLIERVSCKKENVNVTDSPVRNRYLLHRQSWFVFLS